MVYTKTKLARKAQHKYVASLPADLTPIPPEQFPQLEIMPVKAWLSRLWLVQLYQVNNPQYPGLLRMSVCRSRINEKGRWQDGVTWDELQDLKRCIGYGDWYGVEVYPPDRDVVNVANMRHVWLIPQGLSIGF